MSGLTAVDVLIDPADAMKAKAHEVNARMLQSVPPPTGFALDEHHQPHITTLQRYVRTEALPAVFDAVGALVAATDLASLTFTTAAISHLVVDAEHGIGLSGIVVKPGPAVLDFQARLIDALAPYTGSNGTPDAYVRTAAEPDINTPTLEYIEHYVPDHSGEHYLAHITTGLATLDDLARIEAEALPPLTFGAAGIGVYQLGNNGTAARHLRSWSAGQA
jgi:hypothetical protein